VGTLANLQQHAHAARGAFALNSSKGRLADLRLKRPTEGHANRRTQM